MIDFFYKIENFNNDFLIVSSKDSANLRLFGKAIFDSKLPYIDEVIIAKSELCLKLNTRFDNSKLVEIKQIKLSNENLIKAYKLPIYFENNDDWSKIETSLKKTKAEIISYLLGKTFTLSMLGFLPGFLYLEGLDKEYYLARKATPEKYIKANSLALGGKYLGIYPVDSPAGWYVLGRLPFSFLNFDTLPPIKFNVADKINLVQIEKDVFEKLAVSKKTIYEYQEVF